MFSKNLDSGLHEKDPAHGPSFVMPRGDGQSRGQQTLCKKATNEMVTARRTLIVTDARVLNDELRQTFQQWYPGMQNEEVALKKAA